MLFLKQSTLVTVRLGPFLDATDGVTEETALGSMGVEISKNHGAFAARNSATATAHDAEGWYSCELNTTDTNTLGSLIVKAHASATHVPVWQEYTVLSANMFDSIVADTDKLDASVVQWLGTAVTHATAAGRPDVQVVALNADSVTAAAVATDAIGSLEFSQGAADKVWSSAVRTVTAATNITSTGGTTFTQTGDSFVRLGAPAGASVSADIAAIQADTDNLQTRTPAALVGGRMDSSVGAVAANAIDAAAIAANAIGASELATDAVAEIADQVWDEARADHVAAGSFGQGVVVNSIATDAITALSFAAAAANKIADHVLRRALGTVRSSADGDTVSIRSLLGLASRWVNRHRLVASTNRLEIYQEDDSTVFGEQAVTASTRSRPIQEVDPV